MNIPWFTYIIRCTNGNLYTGSTNHIIRRWHQHREGRGAKYLQAHHPEEVVFIEPHPSRSAACKREYQIKQLSKKEKEVLIRERSTG
ncbi:MAG: GIY-YIG nuclease family protein [Balneolaceae bacterium]|nr:MAG: GIY-YIG nuclease family protein [Balneolaceae bacterium]